jgi:mono/diheme cytochrome c family protein
MSILSPSWVRTRAVLGALLIGLLVLSACGGAAPAPTTVAKSPATVPAAAPTNTVAPPTTAPTDTAVPPTATLAPTETAEPAATATEAPTAVVVADATNCVTCHTSEETLQQLAKEEAPAESLSEGEG